MAVNYVAILDALSKASCQSAEFLKEAEQQLKIWESQPGFYSTLLVSIMSLVMFSTFSA